MKLALYIYIIHIFLLFFKLKYCRNRCPKTAKFQDTLPRLTLENESNRWKIATKKRLSLICSYEWKRNPKCIANLQCEYQELNCKAETIGPFLVLQPSSGVHTFNNVGSPLNMFKILISRSIVVVDRLKKSFKFKQLTHLRHDWRLTHKV